MAKLEAKRVLGLKPTSVAMFQGVFAAVLGFGVAIFYSVRATLGLAEETNSLLAGLMFGMSVGLFSLIVLPLVYFAIGWVFGLVQGWFYNVVLGASGGVVVRLEDDK